MSKQQLIMQKAIELFAEKSISKTSIQDITYNCGISKGAFYLAYPSKEHLLIAIMEHYIKDLTISFQEVLDSPATAKAKLENFCTITLSIFYEKFPLVKMMVSENTHEIQSELILKIQLFEQSLTKIMIKLLEDAYGEKIKATKYDMLLCLKGFIHSYTDFSIHHRQNFQFQKTASTIVYYMDALVAQNIHPTISEEIFFQEKVPANNPELLKNALLDELAIHKANYESSSFYGETLTFIEGELSKDKPNFVILHGMVANLSSSSDFKWLITLIKQYAPVTI